MLEAFRKIVKPSSPKQKDFLQSTPTCASTHTMKFSPRQKKGFRRNLNQELTIVYLFLGMVLEFAKGKEKASQINLDSNNVLKSGESIKTTTPWCLPREV